MARESGIDAELLRAALIGYQIQRERMAAVMADIESQLGSRGKGRGRRKAVAETAITVSAPTARPKRKRKLSAAGRARIVAATKARWEAFRAAKAGK